MSCDHTFRVKARDIQVLPNSRYAEYNNQEDWDRQDM